MTFRRGLDVFLFVAGALAVFFFVKEEFRWHWAVGALLAPVGGAVAVLLGRAGATL